VLLVVLVGATREEGRFTSDVLLNDDVEVELVVVVEVLGEIDGVLAIIEERLPSALTRS